MNDESQFGEDAYGNKYYSYTDKSPNDFWTNTIIIKDKMGNYTIHSCNIIPKEEENEH